MCVSGRQCTLVRASVPACHCQQPSRQTEHAVYVQHAKDNEGVIYTVDGIAPVVVAFEMYGCGSSSSSIGQGSGGSTDES